MAMLFVASCARAKDDAANYADKTLSIILPRVTAAAQLIILHSCCPRVVQMFAIIFDTSHCM
jgi:hypothetical protein